MIKVTALDLASIWIDPLRTDLVVQMPSLLGPDPQCKIFAGMVCIPVKQDEADRVLQLAQEARGEAVPADLLG